MSIKLTEQQQKIFKKLNKTKQINNFRDTFMLILVFNYMEICATLNINPSDINIFKKYMDLVVKHLKILIEDLKKESEILSYEEN